MKAGRILRLGIPRTIATGALVLLPLGLSASAGTLARSYTLELLPTPGDVKGLCPRQVSPVFAAVGWSDGRRKGFVPGIGIVIDTPRFGTLAPQAAITGGPNRIAQFRYRAAREGVEVLYVRAIGQDPASRQQVNLSGALVFNIKACPYELDLFGRYTLPFEGGASLDVHGLGFGVAQVREGDLHGQGTVTGWQTINLTSQPYCSVLPGQGSAPMTIAGSVADDTVTFELDFSLKLSPMALICSVRGVTTTSPIPIPAPVTASFIGLESFQVPAEGGVFVLDIPGPGQGQTEIFVRLKPAK